MFELRPVDVITYPGNRSRLHNPFSVVVTTMITYISVLNELPRTTNLTPEFCVKGSNMVRHTTLIIAMTMINF